MPKSFRGTVEIFAECNMPWYFVRASCDLSSAYESLADRGLIAITAAVGKSSWETSLMPFGDKTHFVPIPAKVRKANNIQLGDQITIGFTLRER